MDFLGHFLSGFQVALGPGNLLYCFIGAALGTLIGVLPGLGPGPTIALLLPITYNDVKRIVAIHVSHYDAADLVGRITETPLNDKATGAVV